MLLEGTSGSNQRNMSSSTGGLGLEKNALTHSSSGAYFTSCESNFPLRTGKLKRHNSRVLFVCKSKVHFFLLGSSSANSSPEFPRKDYGNYCSSSTRGRSESRESEIRARLQSASPSAGRWAELDDVKKLLQGRSSSVSPTRSSCTSITLPVPKKASVETKTISVATQLGQYDTLDSAYPAFTWSTTTLPSTSATTVIGGSTNYSYHVSQVGTNNMSGGSPPISPAPASSLSGQLKNSPNLMFISQGYGVQKNVSNGGGTISTGVSSVTRSQTEDALKRDYKFVVSDKENVPVRRETDMLILAKDSGKQFTSSSLSGDSIKKEKLIAGYSETAALKAETGNSYCELTRKLRTFRLWMSMNDICLFLL
uniref:Uncharacterized protein n=1 Tax=Oryzias melastigma TaxID=30732 RepID=A0A3B3D740_ORYME